MISNKHIFSEKANYNKSTQVASKQNLVNNLQENSVYLSNSPVMNRKLKVAEEGMAVPQESAMSPQEQAPQGATQQVGGKLEQVMQMIQQASEQGGQPQDVIAGLLEQQIAPEIIAQALVQLGMPQEQAVQMIEQVAQGGLPEMATPQGEMGAPEGAPQGAPPMMANGGIPPTDLPYINTVYNEYNFKDKGYTFYKMPEGHTVIIDPKTNEIIHGGDVNYAAEPGKDKAYIDSYTPPYNGAPQMNEGGIATNVFGLLNSANMKDFASMKKKLLKQYKTGGTANFTAEDMSSTEAMSTAMKNMFKSHMFKSYATNAVGKGKANQQKMFDAIPQAREGMMIGTDGVPTWDWNTYDPIMEELYGIKSAAEFRALPEADSEKIMNAWEDFLLEESDLGKVLKREGITIDDYKNKPEVRTSVDELLPDSWADEPGIGEKRKVITPKYKNKAEIDAAYTAGEITEGEFSTLVGNLNKADTSDVESTVVVTEGEKTTTENSKNADSGDTKVVTEGPKKGATQTFDGEKWVTDVPEGPKKGDIQVWDGEKYVTKKANNAGDVSQGQANVNRVKPGLYADNTRTGRGRGIGRNGVGNFLQNMSQIVNKNQIGVQGNMSPEEFAKYSKNNSIAGIDYKRGLFGKEKFSIRFNPNTGQEEIVDKDGTVVDPSMVDSNAEIVDENGNQVISGGKEMVTAIDNSGAELQLSKEDAIASGMEYTVNEVNNKLLNNQNNNLVDNRETPEIKALRDKIDQEGSRKENRQSKRNTRKDVIFDKQQNKNKRKLYDKWEKEDRSDVMNKLANLRVKEEAIGINGEVLDVTGSGPEVQPKDVSTFPMIYDQNGPSSKLGPTLNSKMFEGATPIGSGIQSVNSIGNQIARGEMTEEEAQDIYDNSFARGAVDKLFPKRVAPGMTSTAESGNRKNSFFQDGRQPSRRKLARQERRQERGQERNVRRNPAPVRNSNDEFDLLQAIQGVGKELPSKVYEVGGLIWDQDLLKFVNGGTLPQAKNGLYQSYDEYEEYSNQGDGDQIEAKFKPLFEKEVDVALAGNQAMELGYTALDVFKRKNNFVSQDDKDAALSLDAQMNTGIGAGDEGIYDQFGDQLDPGNPLAGRSGDNFTRTGRSLNAPYMKGGGELVYAQAGLQVGDELELSSEEMMAFARLGYQIKAIK